MDELARFLEWVDAVRKMLRDATQDLREREEAERRALLRRVSPKLSDVIDPETLQPLAALSDDELVAEDLAAIRGERQARERLDRARQRGAERARQADADRASGATAAGTPAPRGDVASPAVIRPVSRHAAHEAAILLALSLAGFDPLALPPVPPGKPSPAKTAARLALPQMSRAVFDKAWHRLRAGGQVCDAPG